MNIMRAREAAAILWMMGYAPICPHLNTYMMGGLVPDDTFLKGDLEFVKRCDLVVMIDGWKESTGARGEKEYAETLGIPVLEWPKDSQKIAELAK